MSVLEVVREAERHLSDPAADALVRDIGIPPRPQILAALNQELALPDPNVTKVAAIVASDVAMTAAVLRVANSPAMGLSRRVETMGQALSMLGLKQVCVIVTGLVVRKVLRTDGPQLARFWDVSAKRAWAVSTMARRLKGVDVDIAQTFGLFCDVGIPLLMQRFPSYGKTLQACNLEATRPFTAPEQDAHQTDHALIGALMARSWNVSQTVCLAIRTHHDYDIFQDRRAPEAVTRLVAMGLVAEVAIQRFARMNTSTEWEKGHDGALGALMLSDHDAEDWIERLVDGFSEGLA
jgi:HD-like signal output (HDOD) protein